MSAVTTNIDPRLVPGAYITDGRRLYEVISMPTPGILTMQNCETEDVCSITKWRVIADWRLVQDAPAVPDVLPDAELLNF